MRRIAYSMVMAMFLLPLAANAYLVAIEFVKNLRIVAAVPLIVSEG